MILSQKLIEVQKKKKRSLRIEGSIFSQKLGKDQTKKRKGLYGTNLILLVLRLEGGPGPLVPPGYANAVFVIF